MTGIEHIFEKKSGNNYTCIFCGLTGKRGKMVGLICPKRGGSIMDFFEDVYQCRVCNAYCDGFDECCNHFDKNHGDWRKFKLPNTE